MDNEVPEESSVSTSITQDGDEFEIRWNKITSSMRKHKEIVKDRVDTESKLELTVASYKNRLENLEKVLKCNLSYLEHCRDEHRFRDVNICTDIMCKLFRYWNSMKFNNFLDTVFSQSTEQILLDLIEHYGEDIPKIIGMLKQKSSQISMSDIDNMYIMGSKH